MMPIVISEQVELRGLNHAYCSFLANKEIFSDAGGCFSIHAAE